MCARRLRANNSGVLAVNLALQSEDLATTWAAVRASVSANAVASPYGATTADKIVEDATAGASHFIRQSVVKAASSLTYCYSAHMKAVERTFSVLSLADVAGATNRFQAWFNLSTGAVGTTGNVGAGWAFGAAGVIALGSGWYRCYITGSTDATAAVWMHNWLASADGVSSYNGDGASGIYSWGHQLEVGTYPSLYVPRTSGA